MPMGSLRLDMASPLGRVRSFAVSIRSEGFKVAVLQFGSGDERDYRKRFRARLRQFGTQVTYQAGGSLSTEAVLVEDSFDNKNLATVFIEVRPYRNQFKHVAASFSQVFLTISLTLGKTCSAILSSFRLSTCLLPASRRKSESAQNDMAQIP